MHIAHKNGKLAESWLAGAVQLPGVWVHQSAWKRSPVYKVRSASGEQLIIWFAKTDQFSGITFLKDDVHKQIFLTVWELHFQFIIFFFRGGGRK